ncbi:hypothetical protein [Thalassotalea mangrovi]|uniref:Uncharacterized protein n=1 Tax=Thalassotalea mangrovi TaxID=2572245 RepID=A0A4U1B2J2_9GAMM|nr:hypothetical protein [Thalassotalea mangrovi]TKB43069.1 hypothetical protein E8M12_16065 [Thalassotalea mangrovi]
MGLIEAILMGITFEKLQKPLVFFSMLIGLLFFTFVGLFLWYGIYEIVVSDRPEKLIPSLGVALFSSVFFGLAYVCGYMIKRCFN